MNFPRRFGADKRRARSLVLLGVVLAAAAACARAQSAQDLQSEKARLDRVRSLIREAAVDRLIADGPSPGVSGPTCKKMREDLLAGRGFEPIEPVEIVNANDPISGGDWRYCGNAEAHGDAERAARLFQSFSIFTGGPPFRIYTIPKSINPYPRADLVFSAEDQPESYAGTSTGRSINWVSLQKCEYWAAAGFKDTLLRWKMKPEVVYGNEKAI